MSAPTPLRTAWLRWKSLKLPWRKKFLVGLDLQGNTFWEFRDTLSSHKHRMRRIVKYPSTVQYSDLNISPSWHQWLRHTRIDPPSLTEQSQDLVRQRNLKILAAEADRRWAEKPSFLDRPGQVRGQPVPALRVKEGYGTVTVRDEMREGAKDVGIKRAVGGGLGDTIQGTDRTVMEAVEGQNGESKVSELRKNTMNERTKNSKLKEKNMDDPWKKARGGPSEEWQPQAWNPNR